MQESIAALQAERKRSNNELPRHDWDTKRAALIESGMVQEAQDRRAKWCEENSINPDDVKMWMVP